VAHLESKEVVQLTNLLTASSAYSR
jgi:hypothetical protein